MDFLLSQTVNTTADRTTRAVCTCSAPLPLPPFPCARRCRSCSGTVVLSVESVIPAAVWAVAQDEEARPRNAVAFAVDVPPGREPAAICSVSCLDDDRIHLRLRAAARVTSRVAPAVMRRWPAHSRRRASPHRWCAELFAWADSQIRWRLRVGGIQTAFTDSDKHVGTVQGGGALPGG
jgi:hypothetical protein